MAQADRLKQKLKQLGLDVVATKPEVKANKQRAAIMAPAAAAGTSTRYSFTLYFPRPPYYGMQFKALKERQGWNFTGLLLGMGGSTLRQLKQQSGANILVANANGHLGGAHPDPLDPSLHALITSDTLENIQVAINLIADLMSPINGHGYKPVKAVSNGSAVLQLALKSADAAPRPAAAAAAAKPGAGAIKVLKQANLIGNIKVTTKASKKRITGLAAGRPAAIITNSSSSSLIEPTVVTEATAAATTPSNKLPLQVGSPQAHTYQLPPVQQVTSTQDAPLRGVPMDKASVPPSASTGSKGTKTPLSALFANLEGFSSPAASQPVTAAAAGSSGAVGAEAVANTPPPERSTQPHISSPVIEGPSASLAAAAAATPKPAAATNSSSSASAAPAPSPVLQSVAPAAATSGPQYNLFAGPPITCGLPWQSPCFGTSPSFSGGYAGAPYSGMSHPSSTISASLLGPIALQPPRSYAFDQQHLLTPNHPLAAGGGGYHQVPVLGPEGQGVDRRGSSMGEQELLDMLRLLDVGNA